MAIEEEVYAEFELENGDKCRIEKTHRNNIHIHIGNTLYTFSVEEFIKFAKTVKEGRKCLNELKHSDSTSSAQDFFKSQFNKKNN